MNDLQEGKGVTLLIEPPHSIGDAWAFLEKTIEERFPNNVHTFEKKLAFYSGASYALAFVVNNAEHNTHALESLAMDIYEFLGQWYTEKHE